MTPRCFVPLLAPVLLSACFDLGPPPQAALAREEVTLEPTLDETACFDESSSVMRPPPELLDGEGVRCDPETEGYCFALSAALRDAAAEADPLQSLARSAAAWDTFDRDGDSHDVLQAQAFAALAVTGARAYAEFARSTPRVGSIPGGASVSAQRRALDRAYAVAWALRGPPAYRLAARPDLGWIAVSSEDLPARPVNIPAANVLQDDLDVQVAMADGGMAVDVRTRMTVTSTSTSSLSDVPRLEWTLGELPDETMTIPREGPVVLFVPGHSSLAEEGAPLGEALVDTFRERGLSLTFIAVDLPSNGYATRIDPAAILEREGFADDALLRFHDRFVLGLVDALERRQPGIRDRIAAVVGGSLGGNLVMRLSQHPPEWLPRVVAWSPASIDVSWARARPLIAGDGEFVDLLKHEAVRITRAQSETAERAESRREYFVGGLSSVRNQAGYWYRDDWACRDRMIEQGLHQLGEIYDERFRRWHYRVAYEQLVASHLEVDPDDGRRAYERIAVPLLLVTGEQDDAIPMQTRSCVERLGEQLTMEGWTLFLRHTGHALHSERPRLLAEEIARFVADTGSV